MRMPMLLEREQHPQRDSEPTVEAVATHEAAVGAVRDQVIRPAVAGSDFDHRQPPVDAKFLDGFVLAADDSDLRFELRVAGDLGWGRRRLRQWLELWRRWRFLRECRQRDADGEDGKHRGRSVAHHAILPKHRPILAERNAPAADVMLAWRFNILSRSARVGWNPRVS